MAAWHEEGCYENKTMTCFLVFKGRSNNDVGGAKGAPVFRIYDPGLVSKPVISFLKSWWGLP